jgi:uncharacterized protein YxeA
MDQNQASPLAAFPKENQQSSHPIHSRPKKILFIVTAITLLLIISISGANIFLKDTKIATKSPSVRVQPTAVVATADWDTYTNTTYGYDIKYEKEISPKEENTTQYGYTELASGCIKVYAVPTSKVSNLPEEKNGIPWQQLDDLKGLPIGQSRNCSTLMFTFGPEGKSVIDRNDYTRQNATTIGNQKWYTFTVKNADTATVDKDTVYITEKNTYTFVIETKTGGYCPTTTDDMLSTFTFSQ